MTRSKSLTVGFGDTSGPAGSYSYFTARSQRDETDVWKTINPPPPKLPPTPLSSSGPVQAWFPHAGVAFAKAGVQSN